jgi:hypothetical protein
VLFVPDATAPGKPSGGVLFTAPDRSIGVRFTPDWRALRGSVQQAEEWFFAYAAGVVDCELVGGFGIDLRYD